MALEKVAESLGCVGMRVEDPAELNGALTRAFALNRPVVIDVHSAGCVSFIYMMDLARSLMTSHGAKTALICNVQSAAGHIFVMSHGSDVERTDHGHDHGHQH